MNDRFKQIVEFSGQSVKDFAADVGLHPNSVSDVLHGRTKSISWPILLLLYIKKKVNLNWLIAGEGSCFVHDEPIQDNATQKLAILMKNEPDLFASLVKIGIKDKNKIELIQKVLKLDEKRAQHLSSFLGDKL